MSGLPYLIGGGAAFLILLFWLLRPRHHSSGAMSSPEDFKMEITLPKHYQYFPQIRQALSVADQKYLANAPPKVARRALRERRQVARQFLGGLREDFSNLERLGRMVASLSPVVSRHDEAERILFVLRFHLLYWMVWVRISSGPVPLGNIERLTELVGTFATRMQQAMATVNALTAERLSSELQS